MGNEKDKNTMKITLFFDSKKNVQKLIISSKVYTNPSSPT